MATKFSADGKAGPVIVRPWHRVPNTTCGRRSLRPVTRGFNVVHCAEYDFVRRYIPPSGTRPYGAHSRIGQTPSTRRAYCLETFTYGSLHQERYSGQECHQLTQMKVMTRACAERRALPLPVIVPHPELLVDLPLQGPKYSWIYRCFSSLKFLITLETLLP